MTGAGVPRPVHPKSQTQRSATENPSTDGSAASHRQCAVPAVSTRKPSHCGNSQNHRPKNALPTASAEIVVSHRSAFAGVLSGGALVISQLSCALMAPSLNHDKNVNCSDPTHRHGLRCSCRLPHSMTKSTMPESLQRHGDNPP